MKRSGKSLLLGAAVLAVSGMVVKIIGMFYKIPLANLIGDEGMGYFSSAYTVYTFFYMISTAGLPSAIALIISEKNVLFGRVRAEAVCKMAFGIFSAVGAFALAIMLLFARPFSLLIGNPQSYLSILFIAPTVMFVCQSSVLKGYFQGFGNMLPSAVSQLTEALIKLALGLALVYCSVKKGYSPSVSAALALLGLSIASALSLLYLVLSKTKTCSKYNTFAKDSENASIDKERGYDLIKRILSMSLPIAMSASVMSLASGLDLLCVMRRLCSVGYSPERANLLFGNYSSLVVPVFSLPSVFIAPIASVYSPKIRECCALSDDAGVKSYVKKALTLSSFIAIPSALGISSLAKPILSFIFVNKESVEIASPMLAGLAPASFFLSMITVSSALLQAAGKMKIPMISMCAGALVKVVSSYILTGYFGISGAPMSTFLCYMTAFIINMAFVSRFLTDRIGYFDIYIKPFTASAGCSFFAVKVYETFSLYFGEFNKTREFIAIACAVFFGAAVYIFIYLVITLIIQALKMCKVKKRNKRQMTEG